MPIIVKMAIACALAAWGVVLADPGAKPDLSGTWKFNLAKSRLEIDPPSQTIFTIEHHEPNFKITRTHVWGGKSDTSTFEAVIGGKEHYQKDGEIES